MMNMQNISVDETYRSSEPPLAAGFKPSQMASSRSRAEDNVRIELDFFVRNGLSSRYLYFRCCFFFELIIDEECFLFDTTKQFMSR